MHGRGSQGFDHLGAVRSGDRLEGVCQECMMSVLDERVVVRS